MQVSRLRLNLTGAVQGVGFRPFVYRLATDEGLGGFVCNTGDGVRIEVEGEAASIDNFVARVARDLPPHAEIAQLRSAALPPRGERAFAVVASAQNAAGPGVVMADLATCAECLQDVLEPANRRYRYPFTTCAQCGPRYSIIEALPYDRARTAMRRFRLCADCRAEYEDPTSRRFHAETVACPACGPQLAFWDRDGIAHAKGDDALCTAIAALRGGGIVAVKGLGGFQLVVDGADPAAVSRLRLCKQRPRKPFALMVATIAEAAVLAEIGPDDRRLLCSPEAPIVLLPRRGDPTPLTPGVAPDNPCLGVMLPTTPLHHLLLRGFGGPVVATSGNLGDEPIFADEREAAEGLRGIADAFLVHDRPILHPVDDSVVRMIAGQPVVLRRARGYAPLPIACPTLVEPVAAFGGHQKAAVAVGEAGRLFLGAHIGDLTSPRARALFASSADALPCLHGIAPHAIACDRHPGYYSSEAANAAGMLIVPVPHHLAHVLAAMVDSALKGPVLGVAWDGTGLGDDGTIWGGEFLVVRDGRYRRVAHLRPFRLPGGEAAIREPRRAALGVLHALGGAAALVRCAEFPSHAHAVLAGMLARRVNAPLTTSAGRLFDAVASLLDLCQVASFEGEAAMAVEFAADRAATCAPLPDVTLDAGGVLDWCPLIQRLIAERDEGTPPEPLAASFHERLAEAIVVVARRVGIADVALTGGCFQNARLTERSAALLRAAGFQPHWHRRIPPNDGGLAAGQIAFAAAPLVEEPV